VNNLKTVVEGLLATHSTDVWSTYGGLNRVTKEVEQILYHGLRSTQVRYIIIKLKPISNPII
jgi:run domain Beclin-1 interacting cysteine-rich containing protein